MGKSRLREKELRRRRHRREKRLKQRKKQMILQAQQAKQMAQEAVPTPAPAEPPGDLVLQEHVSGLEG